MFVDILLHTETCWVPQCVMQERTIPINENIKWSSNCSHNQRIRQVRLRATASCLQSSNLVILKVKCENHIWRTIHFSLLVHKITNKNKLNNEIYIPFMTMSDLWYFMLLLNINCSYLNLICEQIGCMGSIRYSPPILMVFVNIYLYVLV